MKHQSYIKLPRSLGVVGKKTSSLGTNTHLRKSIVIPKTQKLENEVNASEQAVVHQSLKKQREISLYQRSCG